MLLIFWAKLYRRARLYVLAGFFALSLGVVPRATQAQDCPPGPEPSIRADDAQSLTRYLARAVAMNGMASQLVPAPFAWNTTPDGTPCYLGGPPNDPASYRDSLICSGLCNFAFCPSNFAADVDLLMRLRATFVQFAAGSWVSPEVFVPGSDYLRAVGQTTLRINQAFDCAGLPRPLIQASVLENVDASQTCAPPTVPCEPWLKPGPPGTNSGANYVPIPPGLITEFMAEIQADSARAHYLDAAGNPRAGLFFNFFRLAYQVNSNWYSPDITRLEGRMWLFYQAQTYIDLGYTSLHMGQPLVWGRLSRDSVAARTRGLQRVGTLMDRIRRYARSRPGGPRTLVLLAEPMSVNTPGEPVIVKFVNGTTTDGRDRYIFDLEMATMRPRETSPALDERAHTEAGTDYTCPTIDPAALATRACTGQYMATIDPCHGYSYAPDGGGITPQGHYFASQKPYSIYFDHGETVLHQPNGDLVPTGKLTPDNYGTWGWDDSAWFSAALSDSCQADWLRYQYANVRTFSPSGLGFLAAPGRLFNNAHVGLNLGPGIPDQPAAGVPNYRLTEHPLVVAATLAAWEPTVPQPVLRVLPGAGLPVGQCADSRLFKRRFERLPAWRVAVQNPDATSIYTWRIQGPNATDLTLTGATLTYQPPAPGTYAVTLVQDNLGLPPATGGMRTFEVPAVPAVAGECFSRRELRALRRAAR